MIRSMTGFGRARGPVGNSTAELVVRSVNHRFLDLTVKLRDTDASLEPVVRRVFSQKISRGKVEVSVRWKRVGPAENEIAIDERLLQAVLARLAALAEKYPVTGRLEARDLLTIPQIFSIENGSGDLSAEDLAALERLAEQAASSLVSMRETEGKLVAAELEERVEFLRSKAAKLMLRREEITKQLYVTIRDRIWTLLAGAPVDPGRLEQEAALAADRSDIAEELHRLEGHLGQFRELLDSSTEPVGKKLDFLSQEILRELNTVGAKARDLQLIREVLDMKSETEKIREQVQNIE